MHERGESALLISGALCALNPAGGHYSISSHVRNVDRLLNPPITDHCFMNSPLLSSLPPSSLMHPVVFLFLVCALTVLLPLFCLCHVSLLLLFSPPPPPPHPLFVPPALLSSWFTVAPRLLQQVPDRLTDSSSVIFHFEWLIIVSAWFTALTLREALWYLQAAALMRSCVSKGSVKHANLRERKSCSYIRGLHLTHLSLEA